MVSGDLQSTTAPSQAALCPLAQQLAVGVALQDPEDRDRQVTSASCAWPQVPQNQSLVTPSMENLRWNILEMLETLLVGTTISGYS